MARRAAVLRTIDRDTRLAEIAGRRFEVHTCRNTRGNIVGYGIFEPTPTATGLRGTWHITPGQALLTECRDWLDALATSATGGGEGRAAP